jgi:hypothetical protein
VTVLLIPGTSLVVHLRENLAVSELVVPDDALAALDDIARRGGSPDAAHPHARGDGSSSRTVRSRPFGTRRLPGTAQRSWRRTGRWRRRWRRRRDSPSSGRRRKRRSQRFRRPYGCRSLDYETGLSNYIEVMDAQPRASASTRLIGVLDRHGDEVGVDVSGRRAVRGASPMHHAGASRHVGAHEDAATPRFRFSRATRVDDPTPRWKAGRQIGRKP